MTDSPEEQPADLDDPQWVDKILARARERAAAAVEAPTAEPARAPEPSVARPSASRSGTGASGPTPATAPSTAGAAPADAPATRPPARRRPDDAGVAPDGARRRPRPRTGERRPDGTDGPEGAPLTDGVPDPVEPAAATPRPGPRPGGPRPASSVAASEPVGTGAATGEIASLEPADEPRWGASASASPSRATTAAPTAPAASTAPSALADGGVDGRDDQEPPGGDDEPDDDAVETRTRLRSGIEWVAVAVGAVVVALVIRAFVLQAFYIPSESMVPTLKENDRILVNKLSYRLHDVNRGDLVVFHKPPNEPPGEASDLIKRVIGLPGETLELRGNDIYIDGRRLTEPYLTGDVVTSNLGWVAGCSNAQSERTQCTVPPGHIFVMGDNRTRSHDSRFFGPISEELIVGRAFVRVWPLGELGFL